MDKEEFGLAFHELRLELELFRRTGKAFQDFFEQIMQKADPTFIMVKPMGKEGDWKADGYSTCSQTVYQCYAPEQLSGTKAAAKVVQDFAGARSHWQGKMQRWVFVWSSTSALPPQVAAKLAELKTLHPDLVIDHIGRAGLWEIIRALPLSARESLLGFVPDVSEVQTTTAAEIQILLNHLRSVGTLMSDTLDLDLTAIAEKLRRNGLSASVTAIVTPAMPVAKLVRDFVTRMPDLTFSQAIALDLKGKYVELSGLTDDPDVIFGNLIEYVSGRHRHEPKFFWAAAGIVTHYFELCDIFEH